MNGIKFKLERYMPASTALITIGAAVVKGRLLFLDSNIIIISDYYNYKNYYRCSQGQNYNCCL